MVAPSACNNVLAGGGADPDAAPVLNGHRAAAPGAEFGPQSPGLPGSGPAEENAPTGPGRRPDRGAPDIVALTQRVDQLESGLGPRRRRRQQLMGEGAELS